MADEDEVECPECEVCEECVAGAPAWMATFSDLVTLLLCFFVLLYAMSKTEVSKFNSVAGSIRKAFAGNARFRNGVLLLEGILFWCSGTHRSRSSIKRSSCVQKT